VLISAIAGVGGRGSVCAVGVVGGFVKALSVELTLTLNSRCWAMMVVVAVVVVVVVVMLAEIRCVEIRCVGRKEAARNLASSWV
jgi:uncharacterized protein (DUF983 family)